MELKEIQTKNCPDCGSICISETRENPHTNGHYNEYRKFKCGKELHFVPNYMKVIESSPCTKSKYFKQKIALESALIEKITSLINSDETVSEKFKEQLLLSIAYV